MSFLSDFPLTLNDINNDGNDQSPVNSNLLIGPFGNYIGADQLYPDCFIMSSRLYEIISL